MAELTYTNISAASVPTPAAGSTTTFVDPTTKALTTRDDAGFCESFGVTNQSTADQSPAATTRTYLTGSALAMPTNKGQVGTCFEWVLAVTKTAAGTAASTYDIAVGTAGTTADTARVSFTKPAGTAAVDEGLIKIRATLRGPLSASAIVRGSFAMQHNGNTAGHATIPTPTVSQSSTGFDVTVANLIFGICVTSGASDALTFTLVQARAWNL